MNIKNILYFVFCIFLFQSAFAQDGDPLQFEMDYARFRASDGWTMLEMYFSTPRELLEHREKEGTYHAEYTVTISFSLLDSVINETSFKRTDIVDSLDGMAKKQHVIDVYRAYLKEGSYTYNVELKDENSGKAIAQQGELNIEAFSYSNLDISDIQLAYQIKPSPEKNNYVKSGYFVMPNPAQFYGQDHEVLYFYTEIYNLSPQSTGSDSSYTVISVIRDMNDQVIDTLKSENNQRISPNLVKIGRKKLISLYSSNLKLEVTIIDNGKQDSVIQSKRFLVLKPGSVIATGDQVQEKLVFLEEYQEMEEEELDEEFKKARYIAMKAEKDVYSKLDLEGKREFMAQFWKRRDPVASTAINEFKRDYFERIELANIRFSSGSKAGWRTDQGRILLTYGTPDKIDRSYASLGDREMEVWYYDTYQGGVEFVFVDVSGYGQMRLVHSTAIDELQDYNWRERWQN